MPAQLMRECCKVAVSKSVEDLDVVPAGQEATCDTCGRYWFSEDTVNGRHEWVCPEPGLGVAKDVDEEGKEVERTVTLRWGG